MKDRDPAKTKTFSYLRKTRLIILFSVLTGFSTFSFSQSANISGVVNSYYRVIEVIPAKACVRVSNPAGLTLNTRVMLVQMKGASINTNNTINFGDTTNLNQAGNYEIGTICYIIGDSVFLFHQLLNTYNYSSGKVQLVQFAEYYTAVVVDTLKASPWDSATGKGGVIAIFCDQDLTLNAPISADSMGFKGGTGTINPNCVSNSSTGYYYNANSTSNFAYGAFKGENIFELPSTMTGGRGAPANGGGGGNNHNNGGGGGSNLSAGGYGGGNSSTTGCTGEYHGLGGKALSSWNGKKIFLGGGGGAGHMNGGLGGLEGGGDGGGIVFLLVNNLNTNGYKISANGAKGTNAVSDGAAGGGAGGTIIITVLNSITGSLIVQANGGKGGDEDDGGNSGRCYGAGGGGSGGVIYFAGSLPAGTITVNGGAAGLEISRDVGGCTAAVLPAAGSNGTIVPLYTYSTSTSPASYCALLLPVQLEYFYASPVDKKVKLEWKILNPADVAEVIIERSTDNHQWIEWNRLRTDDQILVYSVWDTDPFRGKTFYRLRFIEKNHTVSYSPVRLINLREEETINFYPNPARDKLVIITKGNLPVELKLLDISGKVFLKTLLVNARSEISISSLAKGVYLLSVNGRSQKLVIYR